MRWLGGLGGGHESLRRVSAPVQSNGAKRVWVCGSEALCCALYLYLRRRNVCTGKELGVM